MKAMIQTSTGPVLLNCDYLSSVGRQYTFFQLPDDEADADLLRHVGEQIIEIRRGIHEGKWQVQVVTEAITWED